MFYVRAKFTRSSNVCPVRRSQWNLIALTDAPAQVSHTNKLMKDFLFSLLSETELSFGIFFFLPSQCNHLKGGAR